LTYLIIGIDGMIDHFTVIGSILIIAIALIISIVWLKRCNVLEKCFLPMATLAVLASHELLPMYRLLKPIPVILLLGSTLLFRLRNTIDNSTRKFYALLALGLLFSLFGDIIISMDGSAMFLVGLGFFLCAHIFYLLLFKQQVTWFPSLKIFYIALILAVVVYSVLWRGIRHDLVLSLAVAVYALMISIMGAQAIGRAIMVRNRLATYTAIGSVLFIMSDIILGIGTFAYPFKSLAICNLIPYFLAQLLIAHATQPRYVQKNDNHL
jgi:alkylglycerol monooxygenase